MWHDIWLRWLAWAIYSCTFFSVEILISRVLVPKSWYTKWWWNTVVAITSPAHVLMLIIANSAIHHGFEDTAKILINSFYGWEGLRVFVGYWFLCSLKGAIAIRIREVEQDNDIATKKDT